VQLSVAAIEAFRDRIDWSQPDVDAQVNRLDRPNATHADGRTPGA
jgi:hypothetical protein